MGNPLSIIRTVTFRSFINSFIHSFIHSSIHSFSGFHSPTVHYFVPFSAADTYAATIDDPTATYSVAARLLYAF